jgi:hypothetical protein
MRRAHEDLDAGDDRPRRTSTPRFETVRLFAAIRAIALLAVRTRAFWDRTGIVRSAEARTDRHRAIRSRASRPTLPAGWCRVITPDAVR